MNPTPERTEGGMPRLLRSTHVTPWADRHAIYPADAARSAFEDAATSEYAKEYWAAKLNQALAQNDALRGALEEISEQKRLAEMEDDERHDADFETAYDECVRVARHVLSRALLTTTPPAKA